METSRKFANEHGYTSLHKMLGLQTMHIKRHIRSFRSPSWRGNPSLKGKEVTTWDNNTSVCTNTNGVPSSLYLRPCHPVLVRLDAVTV